MRHKIITEVGGLFLAVTIALFLGGVTPGCGSGAVLLPGQAGEEVTTTDELVLEVAFDFLDGDVLDVEDGLEVDFNEPIDPESLYDENGVPRIAFFNANGEEMEIIRMHIRNDGYTLFFAVPFRAQAQYMLRIAAGLRSMNGAELAQPVQMLFITTPNRFSLFGDNASSLADVLKPFGYAIPGTVFAGDGSVILLADILDRVLVVGDGIDMVVGLKNLNRNGAAVITVEDADTGLREARYAAKIEDGFKTGFTDQSAQCQAQNAASLRDLNGDGRAEIDLTYVCEDGAGNRSYQDYIFFGRDFGAEVSLVSADFAFSVPAADILPPAYGAVAGDVNGDGFSDLARVAYDAAAAKGVVHIYMGGANGLAASTSEKASLGTPSVVISSAGINDSPLHIKLGDVNGDGIDDIVLVELMVTLPDSFSYRYMVILGRESFPAQMDTSEPFAAIDCGNQISCGEGRNAFEVADIDGDEIADLLIGSSQYTGAKAPIASSGIVYVIFGGEEIKDDEGRPIETVSMADRYIFSPNSMNFGMMVEYMGDMYNDGGNYFTVVGKNVDLHSLEYFMYDGRELKEMGGKVVGEDYVLDVFVLSTDRPE